MDIPFTTISLANTLTYFRQYLKAYHCQCTEHTKGTVVTKVSRCVQCGKDYCEACWDRIDPHKGESSRPHKRYQPMLVDMLNDVLLATEKTEEQKHHEHKEDARNLWFGVFEHDGTQYIYEGPSYESLIFENVAVQPWGIYPGLVTFVGDTGAGKSTLIKLLIHLATWKESKPSNTRSSHGIWHSTPFPGLKHRATPIVGTISNDDFTPTSADVHLYADPNSLIFYADCEGLRGGNQEPVAVRYATTSEEILLECVDRFKPKRIAWADSEREDVVKSLYPRLLYSFSDTIVFVLENHKKFEEVFTELVEWGHRVIEKACNQSVLPNAIIVLNKAPVPSSDKERWGTEITTKKLLESAMDGLKKTKRLQEKVGFWKDRNVTIDTPEDLLKRYYASFTAIRVPNADDPALVESQIKKLYQEISEKCETSQEKRREERMQLNAVDMRLYLRKAFEHFAADQNEPFDFIKASFDINPGSASFGLAGGISHLTDIVQKCLGYPGGSTVWDHIIRFVASCMYLRAYRLNIPGAGNSEGIFRHFWGDCESAIREFYDKKLRCDYRKDTIEACVNVKNGHRKGHQSARGTIEGGNWTCAWSYDSFVQDVKGKLLTEVKSIGQVYRDIGSDRDGEEDELCKAYRCHQTVVRQLQESLGDNVATFRSHFVCLSCLMEAPEHTLPCGHTLCTLCISAVGRSLGSGFFETESCPIDSDGVKLQKPYIAAVKPAQAGVRILTLDGGGVRGIVELEILRAIELELDDKVPIQAFFDLIVGTSTGGIIALGLGHEGWTVEDCAEKFKRLAKDAFRPHRMGCFSEIISGTKYLTKPFNAALESAFSADEVLFGSGKAAAVVRTKTVLVTQTLNGPVTLLSNYNRKVSESERYRFFRGANPSEEIKTCESARATSAAPWYWEIYSHGASGQIFLDGGISHNNPIRIANSEQKAIWPERKHCHPDVLLAIGTGYHSATSSTAISRNLSSGGALALMKTGWQLGSKLLQERLDSEVIWQDWIETRMPLPEHLSRYRRVNLPLDSAPQMDNIEEMEKYGKLTQEYVKDNQHNIRDIAYQLIASCFYFRYEKETLRWKDKMWVCKGHIECRLPPGNKITKAFGEVLQNLSDKIKSEKVAGMKNSLPGLCFCVTEMHLDRNDVHVLNQDIIDHLKDSGHFEMAPIEITITSEAADTNIIMLLHSEKGGQIPISGFPRNLLKDFPDTYRKKRSGEEGFQEPKETREPRELVVKLIHKFVFDNVGISPSRKQKERQARSKESLYVEKVTSSHTLSKAGE